jgi:hypothetical protein
MPQRVIKIILPEQHEKSDRVITKPEQSCFLAGRIVWGHFCPVNKTGRFTGKCVPHCFTNSCMFFVGR